MSGVGARRGFAFQDMLLAERLLRHASRTRAGIIEGVPCAPEPEFGVEASAALSGEEGPEWDLLERGPDGVLSLEEVKSGRMDVGDRRTLWLRVRAQFQKASPDERERLRICLSVNSEKPPQALPSWKELGAWVNDPANEEVIAQFSSSPVPTSRVADVTALAQEAIQWLTGSSDVSPLDSGDALRLLRRFRLSLESESEVRDGVRRQLEELSQGLAIEQLMDCIRGAISRHAEGPTQWRVFRPSQLLEDIDVLERLQTVDPHEAALWRDIETWGRTAFGQAEPLDRVLAYVDWRRVQPHVSSAVDVGEPVALLGRGGLGKSTALQHYLAELVATDGDEAGSVWVLLLDASQLASCLTPSSSQGATGGDGSKLTLLRGALSLGAFVARTRGQRLAVGVDAVEALGDLGRIQTLLSSLLAASGRDIRVLVTCRATTWNELKRSQQAVHGWDVAELTDWSPEVVGGVVEAQLGPSTIRQLAPSLLALLRTPLFLDLFLRTTGEGEGFRREVSSRRELLAAYWQRRILPCGDTRSLARGQLLRDVAQRTMEGSEHHHLPTAASSDMSSALRDLASEGLFVVLDGTFQFRHALLRDFAIAQFATEAGSPLQQLCGISSHFVRLGALEFWLESEIPPKGGFARLRQELDQIQPGALVDVASSLGQLGNVGSVELLELTAGMQPGNVQRLMVQATRWARLAGNEGWMLAVASLPAHSAWAEATPWIERELIEELLDLIEAATLHGIASSSTNQLAETLREWLRAPRFVPMLTDSDSWLQGRAFSVIGRAAPNDATLRWFIQSGGVAGSPRIMITSTLRDMVNGAPLLDPDLLVKACLMGAGLRRTGRLLQWDGDSTHNWMSLQPYFVGKDSPNAQGWLDKYPEVFMPIAVALIAGLEWHEYQKHSVRADPDLEAFIEEFEAAQPAREHTDAEKQALLLVGPVRVHEEDESDVVPHLMSTLWKGDPYGPGDILDWIKTRALDSLTGDGRFFDQVIWPAVRDGASLSCRLLVLDLLAPSNKPSSRSDALAVLLQQPALYRASDAQCLLQHAIRLYWPTASAPVPKRILECILYSAQDPAWTSRNIHAPGPLLSAIPEDDRPKNWEPFLALYQEAGLSLELEREPKPSRPSKSQLRRGRTSPGTTAGVPQHAAWARLLALPDSTINSRDPTLVSEATAALREIMSNLPDARSLIEVEGGPRRLRDLVQSIVQTGSPADWPLTSAEVEQLLAWTMDNLSAFSQDELLQNAPPFDGSHAVIPLIEGWMMLADMGDLLLRAFPADVARHQAFFGILDTHLATPNDTLAFGILFHVHGWSRANGAGKSLLENLLTHRVRNLGVLRCALGRLSTLSRGVQRNVLDTWLRFPPDPTSRCHADFLRDLAMFVGGQALLKYEDGTTTASHAVLAELIERCPTGGLLSKPERHAEFLSQSVFGAKEMVVYGHVPTKSCWNYGDQVTRIWRALRRDATYDSMKGPMIWIFLPLFGDAELRRSFDPPHDEWRQWWAALVQLAQAVMAEGSPIDVQWVLKGLASEQARKHARPDEILELLERFRQRSRDLRREDLQSTPWWYQTFEAACDVADKLSRCQLDDRQRHELIDIVREWAGPPLNLSRAAQAVHAVRAANAG